MEIEKTVQLTLNTQEIWCLKTLVRLGQSAVTACAKRGTKDLGLENYEMKLLGDFAFHLEDL